MCALTSLPDCQLVSGGSVCLLLFWDTSRGTLLQGFRRHAASVLTIAASPEGDLVFAAGIDERIAMFRKITGSDGTQLPHITIVL